MLKIREVLQDLAHIQRTACPLEVAARLRPVVPGAR